MKKFLLLTAATLAFAFQTNAQCNDLFISEYVEGSGNNKGLEIYNSSNNPINLGGYRLVRYDNGSIVVDPVQTQPLPGNITLAPKETYVIVVNLTDPNGTGQSAPADPLLLAKADTLFSNGCGTEQGNIRTMCFNGDDALALEKLVDGAWVRIDIFGCIGERPVNSQGTNSPTGAWTALPPFSSMPAGYDSSVQGPYFMQYWTQDQTLVRKRTIESGVNVNPAPETFNPSVQWDSLPENTFDSLGFHTCVCNIVGINDIETADKSEVFPNPSNEFVQIRSALQIQSVALYSITGQLKNETILEFPTQETSIETSGLRAGSYLVHVRFDNGLQTVKKLLVQH